MKSFASYLKRQSPPMQLPSFSNGWLEMPNGQRWNPGHQYKFNARQSGRRWWHRLFRVK